MANSSLAYRSIPWLLVLFAFFTPFSIAGAHISLALATVAVVAAPEGRRELAAFGRERLASALGLWTLVSIVAVVFAVDPGASAEKLKKIALIPLIPLAGLAGARARIRPMLGALIASTAVVSAWGLVEFVQAGGGLGARLRGISGFYMTVAGILMIVGLLVVGVLDAARKDLRPRKGAFLGVCGTLILLALVATFTRGSMLGFGVGVVWMLRRRRFLLLGAATALIAVLALGPPTVRETLASAFDPDHGRNVERRLIWSHGVDLLQQYPLTGTGLVIPPELMDVVVETPEGKLRVHSHMHNVYLQIAVTMGLPALLVFLWLVFEWFRLGSRAARARLHNFWEEGLVAAYPAILIALLVNGLVEWNFGDSEILGLFYFLTGAALGVARGPAAPEA